MALTKPLPRKATARVSVRHAGGDNEVERDGMGRPRILVDCEPCHGTGKIRSLKREGRLNKCQRCKMEGERLESYTRVTTFIDCLDDTSTLKAWHGAMVLKGAALDPGFLKDVAEMNYENPADKSTILSRAEAAMELAGAGDKAKKGTFLHGLTELTDVGDDLPDDLDPDDFLDVMSYDAVTKPLLDIVLMEQLMVNDEYRVAGTPDRVSRIKPGIELVAPCGRIIEPWELLITDLKTGRIDYGALKIAMQLAIYSRSKRYDKKTGRRIAIESIAQDWGLIMHTPAGENVTTLHWADLSMGWEAVAVAKTVRDFRSRGRKALIPVNLSAA